MGVTDGGGNTLAATAMATQCTNVVCNLSKPTSRNGEPRSASGVHPLAVHDPEPEVERQQRRPKQAPPIECSRCPPRGEAEYLRVVARERSPLMWLASGERRMHGPGRLCVPVNGRREQLRKEGFLPEDLFRARLGEPHHYAYVVDDIEATVKRLVDQLGAGPFFLIENVPLQNVRLRAVHQAEFVHNSAFGSCDGSPIELIEVVSRRRRIQRGFSGARPRIQHVGYVVPATQVTDLRTSLDERGLTQYLSSQFGDVETTLRDASATLGHDIEIHVDNQGLHDFLLDAEQRYRGLG